MLINGEPHGMAFSIGVSERCSRVSLVRLSFINEGAPGGPLSDVQALHIDQSVAERYCSR